MSELAERRSTDSIGPLEPPTRLLCGPGPSNVHPRVQQVMQSPLLGHLDPVFHGYMTEIVDLLASVYRRSDGLTLPLSSSGTSGMEAGLIALLDPGDTAIIANAGFFGARIVDLARRRGATVVELTAPFGQAVGNDEIVAAVGSHPEATVVCVVHAETSTGVQHDLEGLGSRLADSDVLLLADCVTSLGGIRLEAEAWGVDYCYSCTQKALGCPPGMSPISLSPRAREAAKGRTTPAPYSLDLEELARYWVDRPITYHHTTPNLQFYALHEGLRIVLEEGLEARWARHLDAGRYFQAEVERRGFEILAADGVRLPQLTAVRVPEGVSGPAVQKRLLDEFSIEVGGGLGPTAPPIWRVGLMGVNATREAADRVLAALDATVPQGT